MRRLVTVTVVVAAVVFVWAVVYALLAEVQSDYLGTRSEAAGGFDPTVFPPFDLLTWLMAMSAPVLTGSLLVLTIVVRVWYQRNIDQRLDD